MAFRQSHKAFVAAVQGTARKPASTVLGRAAAGRRLRRRAAAVACPSVAFLARLVFSYLGVVWVVIAVVAESRLGLGLRLRRLPLPGCTPHPVHKMMSKYKVKCGFV